MRSDLVDGEADSGPDECLMLDGRGLEMDPTP